MTLSDIDNETEYTWVKHVVKSWERIKEQRSQDLPHDIELVLEYHAKGYYLVSWTKQYIAWLVVVDSEVITKGHRDPISQSHLGECLGTPVSTVASNKSSRSCRTVRVLVRCKQPITLYADRINPNMRIISDRHRLSHHNSSADRKHVSTFSNSYAIDQNFLKELKSVMLYGYSGSPSFYPVSSTQLDISFLSNRCHILGDHNLPIRVQNSAPCCSSDKQGRM